MKWGSRPLAFAVLAVVLAAGLAGCSSGGSSEPDMVPAVPFDFSGKWLVSSTATFNPCNNVVAEGDMTLAQSGATIVASIDAGYTELTGAGACNSATGTIVFDVPSADGGVIRWTGVGTSETIMSGTRVQIGAGCGFEATWTAVLLARN